MCWVTSPTIRSTCALTSNAEPCKPGPSLVVITWESEGFVFVLPLNHETIHAKRLTVVQAISAPFAFTFLAGNSSANRAGGSNSGNNTLYQVSGPFKKNVPGPRLGFGPIIALTPVTSHQSHQLWAEMRNGSSFVCVRVRSVVVESQRRVCTPTFFIASFLFSLKCRETVVWPATCLIGCG